MFSYGFPMGKTTLPILFHTFPAAAPQSMGLKGIRVGRPSTALAPRKKTEGFMILPMENCDLVVFS